MNTQFQRALTVIIFSIAFIISGSSIMKMIKWKLKATFPQIILFIAVTIGYILAIIFFVKSF